MTVMRETGQIVVCTWEGTLHQLLLLRGRLRQVEIKSPCGHRIIFLLCVQVAGHEYLALSCHRCHSIKLMNLNKQMGKSSESQLVQYEVITAFIGEYVGRMCHGEENRLFVLSGDKVLVLNISSTNFTEVRIIRTGQYVSLCYVPDPHRLLVVSNENEIRAVFGDDKIAVWRHGLNFDCLLYAPSHDVILVTDVFKNKTVPLHPGTGLQMQEISLYKDEREIRAMCLFNDQIIVACDGRISYFRLK